MNLQLKPEANTNHDDAREMYSCYGAHITDHEYDEDGELTRERDITLQAVEFDWLDDDDDDAVAEKIVEEIGCTSAAAEQLLDLARRVRGDMEGVESYLEAAVAAYEAGDLEATIEALNDARNAETEHGDDPSTSALRAQLLEEAEENDELAD